MTRRRRLAVGVCGAAVAAAAATWAVLNASAGAAGDPRWVAVRRQDLVVTVPVSGTLTAQNAAYLGPPSLDGVFEYKITFLAPEGSAVRQGQVVLGFDPSDLEKKLLDQTAERDAADEKLKKLRADLEMARRTDELNLAQAAADRHKAELQLAVPPELRSRFELANEHADLDLAVRKVGYYGQRLRLGDAARDAQVAALAAARDHAARRVIQVQAGIASLQVTAPRAGTVVYHVDRQGLKKKVGDSCWRSDAVVEIPDLTRLAASGEIDEADLGAVARGQRVTLRLDAHPEVSFAGSVLAQKPQIKARTPRDPTKVVMVDIQLAQTDPQRMRPGMRFVGTVEVARAPQAVVAPLAAVVARPDGAWVYRRSGFGVEALRPRLGRHDGTWVEVLSGLRPGDLLRRSGADQPPASPAPAGRQRDQA